MRKRIYLFLLFIGIFLFNINNVHANSIYNIDVDVKLDKDGTGHITEKWNMNVDNGTEVYKALFNLENSEISNFTASMDGTPYTLKSKWNIKDSMDEKAYKNGIYKDKDEIQLCWGMSTYGKHIYTITYDVSNMIYNVSDNQVLYWRFLDNNKMNPNVSKYHVTVSGPDYYDRSLPIWGYGNYGGYAFVDNGYIEMQNADSKSLYSNEYVVLLVQYPLNTFDTTNNSSKFKNFDDFISLANTNSTSYKTKKKSFIVSLLDFIFDDFFKIIVFILALIAFVTKFSGNIIKEKIDTKNINYFRDIPCDKDIMNAYFISSIYNIYKNKEDIIGAIFLKLLLNKNISIDTEEKDGLFGKKTKNIITLYNDDNLTSLEKKFYSYLTEVAKDNKMTEDELKKWFSSNSSKMTSWLKEITDDKIDYYKSLGHIKEFKKGNSIFSQTSYQADTFIKEEAEKLMGLKKYLKDFTLIKEKKPIEVNLWEYYLIYAEIFGIADEVAKTFKKFYPEIFDNPNCRCTYYNYGLIHGMSSSFSSSYRSASSYHSGGGGFSSGGGGGGSFGGGGGGCR